MIKLRRLRRRLMAAQTVREFRGTNDKEAKHLRRELQRPILEDKWKKTREAKVEDISNHRRSAEELLRKKDQLQQRWIEADRKDNNDEAVNIKAKIEALQWVIGEVYDV